MAVYPGKHAMVYLSTSKAGAATIVAALTEWTLDQTTDKYDVTAFLAANKTFVQGLKDLKGTFKGFFDDTETKPFVAADSVDGCQMALYPSADAPSLYWYGPAWLDVSVSCPVSGPVAISGNYAANGSWHRSF